MFKRIVFFAFLSLASFVTEKQFETETNAKVSSSSDETLVDREVTTKSELYLSIQSNGFALPTYDSFVKAIDGFNKLKEKGIIKKSILTIIDFNLPSTEKRLWVIDMETSSILFHTLVAHGKNSGDLYANDFSNQNESLKSSLGFYRTSESYTGAHGISLRLDGLEKNKNDNARNRAVVMHGADYVSTTFIKNHKRLGRSFGCPALPPELTTKIINTIKNNSCLFINHRMNKDILI
jgi:hypothetical protein